MPPTLAQLVNVRSQLSEAVLDYLRKLEETLDRTPWFQDREFIAASAIAVPMRVLKESTTRPDPPERDRFRERAPSSSEGGENDDPARREAARDYVDPEIAALYEEASGEKRQEEVPWQQERLQVRRAVVLGGPGSGKSFLTQTTTLDLARAARDVVQQRQAGLDTLELPLHLTLARFADPNLSNDPAAALLELVRLEFSPLPCFLAWLEQRLRSRTTWLLLDALDEVQGKELQTTLAVRLGAIDTQGWNTRVLLTCRPANWSRNLVPWRELAEYELASFNPLEIRQFVQRWFASDKENANALSQALDRNYSLAHAARTPLIATFLCLAHEEAPVTVTTRRVELYAHVVRGLARRAWKERPLARAEPHVDDLVRFLVGIVRPLFQRHPAGNLFTHEEITRELEQCPRLPVPWAALEASRAGQPMPTDASWPTLLRDELLETGILVGAGLRDGVETQFSFAHRSLLEYLVARSLNEEAKTKGWSGIEEFVDKKSWYPAYWETVAFLAGLLDDPEPLLVYLADPTKDDMLHHRLCLAGRCLPELRLHQQAATSWTVPHTPTAPERIANEILNLWLKSTRRTRGVATPFRHLTNTLPFIGAATGPSVVATLSAYLQSKDSDRRQSAALAMGQLGSVAIRMVLPRLIDCMRDGDNFLCAQSAESLGRLGPAAASEAVLDALTDALRSQNGMVSEAGAEALGRFGTAAATERVLSRLTSWLRDSDHVVCDTVKDVFGRLGPAAATAPVVDQLINLSLDSDPDKRERAIDVLGRLGSASATEAALGRLNECLRDSAFRVREKAGEVLSKLNPAGAPTSAPSRLIDSRRDARAPLRMTLPMNPALGLDELGPTAAIETVVSRLIDRLLHDPDSYTRMQAAHALGALGSAAATEAVFDSLTKSLHGHWAVCASAARALGNLGTAAATQAVLNCLLDCLDSPPWMNDNYVRDSVTEALKRLVPAAVAIEPIMSRLTEFLRHPNARVRANTASVLGSLGPTAVTEAALERLIDNAFDSTPNVHVHYEAIEALVRLAPAVNESVIKRLSKFLSSTDAT